MSERAFRRGRRWRLAAVALLAASLASSPWWGPSLLSQLDFFRLRHVEIHGARYLPPDDVIARLSLDTSSSVWDDHEPLARQLVEHLQVRSVRLERRLPGTLVVHVTENLPVALVASPRGFRAVDREGRELPIDPTGTEIDLPILTRSDTTILRLLHELRATHPLVFSRLSDAQREGREVRLRVATMPVRVMEDVAMDRFAELLSVERDLERRKARVSEIDLRFRDQVIARMQ